MYSLLSKSRTCHSTVLFLNPISMFCHYTCGHDSGSSWDEPSVEVHHAHESLYAFDGSWSVELCDSLNSLRKWCCAGVVDVVSQEVEGVFRKLAFRGGSLQGSQV